MGNSAGKESRAGDPLYDAPPALGAAAAAGGSASSPSTSSSRRYSRHRQSSSASGSGLAATRSAVRHALNIEETVDGGYLVPQGVYSGTPDFKARVVRQLMIERRLAPFFKGLEDYDDSWTDTQLLAAIRHQPIPAAEPEPSVVSTSVDSTISHPYSSRSRSESNASSASTSSQQHYQRIPSGRARSGTTSSTGSNSGVDKKGALATALYRNSIECPICFLYYPPFLNSTRCCDQPICSECFVQIKRSEPHVPEHETPAAPGSPEHVTPFGMVELISECACCPYCTEPDFGVTYTPPPFRSGLGASQSAGSVLRATLSRHSSAAGSSVSVGSAGSTMSSSSTTTPTTGRQRRPTIASTAAEVVTTDRIRPDWQLKLANANAHAARRAAAATALHSAAFLLDSNGNSAGGVGAVGGAARSGAHAGEASGSGRRHRHHRVPRPSGLDLLISGMHGHGHSNNNSNNNNSNNSNNNNSNSNNSSSITILSSSGSSSNSSSSTNLSMAQGHSPTRRVSSLLSGSSARSPSQRSRRMVDLEEMMVMEAIRISLIEDEQRREQERDAVERGAAEHLRRRLSATSTTSSNGGSVSASSPALPVQEEEEEEEDGSEQPPRRAVAEEEENKQGTTTASAERATVSAV
ncbi:hypothetical protein BZA70DRAFT_59503 [Myxozyma melibiosi]|uniref:Protein sip5 n=1 Tax=Myxozyma melibiosi TaxID=54550 RepID=A0ABR1F1Q2_9ASCO